MGEIADMILDGILDEETGEFIDDELSKKGGPGYPRRIKGYNPNRKRNVKNIICLLTLILFYIIHYQINHLNQIAMSETYSNPQ